MKYVILLTILGIGVFAGIFLIGQYFPEHFRVDTWISRINDFLYSDGGYQIEQSKVAIANGGFLGVGPGNSNQRPFLPFAYADLCYHL